ncbi:dipeptide ABC transporter ATP-binding protein [Aquamicrobium sp. NLF2-7]|uniref:ABC transporter ATP-binding protein n=1 Tax=Aquamicrobium sp. NLF2-7 TaxID=2918753 RepID=UPI001EFB3DBB|nr:dipeptide ABC transporter ATP-binding protein [Aquamicrobium sp. NLF2-7]MCG8272651.1 dipeptide ABC transporter ATP-binding protein [Aquamicrobium sp. NLF2-7]
MAAEATPLLRIEDLEIRYRGADREVLAVNDVSLELGAGECMALIGESGCGKSTVAMSVMRYLGENGRIAQGRILFRGQDLGTMTEADLRALRRGGIAMVYQDASSALNPTMKIGRQLAEVLETHEHAEAGSIAPRVLEMLRKVGIPDPEGTMGRYPHQLSGGQQQRIVIAMAFLAEPALLILDEPTTALDVTVEAQIIELLARMREEHGTAMLFISHNLGLVRRVCERVSVMYAGQIVERGATATILGAPQHPYTQGLVSCIPRLDRGRADYRLNSIPGQVPRLSSAPRRCTFMDRCHHAVPGECDTRIDIGPARSSVDVRCARWKDLGKDAGPEAPAREPEMPRHRRDCVLSVENMCKTYELRSPFDLFGKRSRQVRAGESISIALSPGETLGIVGESGCGKSTLARVIMGLEAPSSGRVVVLGDDVTGKQVEQRSREQVRNVQMVFQNPDSTLNPLHTVGFILDRAVKLLGGVRDRDGRRREVERLLDLVRLPAEVMRMRAGRLSGGQKQRVAVARAFAGRPALVVADEPTSALDTSVKTAILELLLSVQKQTGTALVFISHDLAVVRYIADRVCVMYLGHVLETGGVEEVFEPPFHPYTQALLDAVPSVDQDIAAPHRPLEGEATSWTPQSRGCPFSARCESSIEGLCDIQSPPNLETGENHLICCHLPVSALGQGAFA